jgi:hypothetical protein
MSSLPEHVRRIEPVQARSVAATLAPYLGSGAGTIPARYVEEAALTVLAAVYQQGGPLREQLLNERARFERLATLVHRASARRGGI